MVSAKIDIILKKLRSSYSREVQLMVEIVSRDVRSATARNLEYIREESGLNQEHTFGKEDGCA